MDQTRSAEMTRFRVWIAGGQHGAGQHGTDVGRPGVSPAAVALEPAEEGTMSAEQAVAYVEAFNRSAVRAARDVCAVAVPVTVEYRGEPRPGEQISRDAAVIWRRA